jgi:hypothetical protein
MIMHERHESGHDKELQKQKHTRAGSLADLPDCSSGR